MSSRDWKKLTFYYFADTYINFNSLVTDLFKIYKTRIWMSAINPASFVTPTASLSMPTPFNMHGISGGQEQASSRRRQHGLNLSQPSPTAYDDNLPSPQGYGLSHGPGARNPYFSQYNQSVGMNHQQPGSSSISGYQHMLQQPSEPFSPYMSSPYHMLNPTASAFATSHVNATRAGRQNQSPGGDWTNNFQGLSLGS